MQTVESVLASILIDATKAQHAANRYSAVLAAEYEDPDSYRVNPRLASFPVPNAALSGLDITLTFSLEAGPGPAVQAGPGQAVELVDAVLDKGSELDARGDLVASVEMLLREWGGRAAAPGTEELDQLADRLVDGVLTQLGRRADLEARRHAVLRVAEVLRRRLGEQRDAVEPLRVAMGATRDAGSGIGVSISVRVNMRSFQVGFREEAPTAGGTGGTAILIPGA